MTSRGADSTARGANAGRLNHVFDLQAGAQSVWDLIGPFDSLPKWHPLVAECTMEDEAETGARLRRIRLYDGTIIVNRLTEHSDAAKTYSYELVKGPFEAEYYRSTLRVSESGSGRCRVEWTSAFATHAPLDEVKRRIESLIGPGVESLKRLFRA